jgi:hypothetical protein
VTVHVRLELAGNRVVTFDLDHPDSTATAQALHDNFHQVISGTPVTINGLDLTVADIDSIALETA